MLVFGKTGAKLKKAKGQVRVFVWLFLFLSILHLIVFYQNQNRQATVMQLTDEEAIEECEREHKYLGRVMLQVYNNISFVVIWNLGIKIIFQFASIMALSMVKHWQQRFEFVLSSLLRFLIFSIVGCWWWRYIVECKVRTKKNRIIVCYENHLLEIFVNSQYNIRTKTTVTSGAS